MMIKKIILFFLLITVSNCGYEPTLKKNFNLSIQNFELIGDKNINRRIVSLLGLKKNLSNTSDYTMTLNSQKSIISTAKDKSGKTSVFRTIINLKLQLNQTMILIINDKSCLNRQCVSSMYKDRNYLSKQKIMNLR